MPRLTVRPSAWLEINHQLEYLEQHAGLDVAERFLAGLMQSGELLARVPQMGAPLARVR
jgi:plasmid stabilization system protein ParE